MFVIGKTLDKVSHPQSSDSRGKAVLVLSCHLGSGAQAVACLQVDLLKCFINFSSLGTYCTSLTSPPLDLIILIINDEEYRHKAYLFVIVFVLLIFFPFLRPDVFTVLFSNTLNLLVLYCVVHILRRNCLLQRVIEGKIQGG
jgi:hypothetical protein